MLRNARLAGVEVDLVMLAPDDFTIVLVEVKHRRGGDRLRALPRHDQRRRLARAARIVARRWPGRPIRGDVILVLGEASRQTIVHLPETLG